MAKLVTKNQIKFVQSLHRKKYRQKYSQFMVEGEKSIDELIHSTYEIDSIFASSDWIDRHASLIGQVDLYESSATDLERMSFFKSASPVIAVVNHPNNHTSETSPWELVLDDIKDPGNLGTILRIADWYGITSVICSEETVDVYNPKTIASTMGSFTRVKIQYTDIHEYLTKAHKTCYFTLMSGQPVYDISKKAEGIIVIGSEANGISDKLLTISHEAITIPRTGEAESLNAAVATAIICDRLLR